MVVQHHPQVLPADPPATSSLVFQQQQAILSPLVEAAVPDEMEDVIPLPAQALLQSTQGRLFQPLDFNHPPLLKVAQGALQVTLLLLDVKLVIVAGAGNHHQNAHGWFDVKRRNRLW